MANKAKFQAIKGTRDLLPPETELWNRVEATAREVFGTFGFGEIRPKHLARRRLHPVPQLRLRWQQIPRSLNRLKFLLFRHVPNS